MTIAVNNQDLNGKMAELSAGFIGAIRQNVSMQEYTSWRIGGSADWLVEPANQSEVIRVLDFCADNAVPLTIIGRGSNLLVSDAGIAGLVLRIGGNLSRVEIEPQADNYLVRAECGVLLAALSRQTAEAGVGGLEWACGIPGNLGGALMMNAGAYGASIGEFVTEVQVAAYTGAEKRKAVLQTLHGDDLHFAYRSGCLPENTVALNVALCLPAGNREDSLMRISEILSSRRQNQPLEYPSAGSVFRNPPGSHAGYLVEQSGCKGLTVGGAQVSEKHGNFIINLGGATAADVLSLIEQVRQIVAKKTGYDLETEVRLLGRQN